MNLSHWAAREVPPRSYLDPDLKKLRECLCVVEYLTRYLMILRNYWYISSVQFSCSACLTLCDPKDCGPPDSSVHGILQERILDELPFPPLRDLPDPGIEPKSLLSPALAGGFFTTSTTWEAHEVKSDSVSVQLLR